MRFHPRTEAAQQHALRQGMVRHLAILAESIAINSTAAVMFNVPDSGQEILSSLRAEPHVVSADIVTKSGAIFASYRRSDVGETLPPPRIPQDDHEFDDTHLHLVRPIVQNDEQLGTIYIRSDLGEIKALFEWVQRNIRYTKDPFRVEVLHSPRRMLELRAGDCDDMAILLGAMLLSVGHPVRLVVTGPDPLRPDRSRDRTWPRASGSDPDPSSRRRRPPARAPAVRRWRYA